MPKSLNLRIFTIAFLSLMLSIVAFPRLASSCWLCKLFGVTPLVSSTRSSDQSIPYIISPRNTALLNDRPVLRWNAVPGASRYTVQVRGGGLDWQTETTDTEIVYPGNPPLQQGQRYLVVVETDQGASSEEEQGVNLVFKVLDDEKADEVRAKAAQLSQQGLSTEAEKLALATLYRDYRLNAAGIELLEELVDQGSQTIAVYQILGEFYYQIGLSELARKRYSKALDLAKQSGEETGQAAVEVKLGLGLVAYGLGNKDEAKDWLTEAKEGFITLGNTSQAQELEQWMRTNLGQ